MCFLVNLSLTRKVQITLKKTASKKHFGEQKEYLASFMTVKEVEPTTGIFFTFITPSFFNYEVITQLLYFEFCELLTSLDHRPKCYERLRVFHRIS